MRPERFVDEQVGDPFGPLGRIAGWALLRRYLRRLIDQRNVHLRRVAERAAGT